MDTESFFGTAAGIHAFLSLFDAGLNAAIGHRICIQFDSERFELPGIIALAAGNDERVVIVLGKWSQVDLRSRPSIEGLGIPGEVCAVVPAG